MVKVYLLINKDLYDTDTKKIAFALSFMKEGSAQMWASTFTKKALSQPTPSFGAIVDFTDKFTMAFVHKDTKSEAIKWLINTWVSKGLMLNDYISQFQSNVKVSGTMNEDTLINFFSRGIPTSLMRRVYSMDTVPDTIEKWYKQAMHFKVQWNKANSIKRNTFNHYTFQNKNLKQETPKHQENQKVLKKVLKCLEHFQGR